MSTETKPSDYKKISCAFSNFPKFVKSQIRITCSISYYKESVDYDLIIDQRFLFCRFPQFNDVEFQ